MPPSTRVRRVRLWLVVAGALVASGCAAITGLDQYVKGDLDASSDAIADQTVADVAHDAPPTDSGNDSTPPDASGDVVADGPVQDGGGDAADATSDAADAGDAGCGPVNTISNCSACGAQCDTTNASNTACNGTTCVYQCKSGFSNCDAAAPDLNGCECPTPTCCGAGCATTHSNGVGQSFYDCVDAGTHDQTQALEACTAYTGSQPACSAGGCVGADGGATGDLVVCGAPNSGGCACWNYQGPNIGYVHHTGNPDAGCFCPNTSDSTWN